MTDNVRKIQLVRLSMDFTAWAVPLMHPTNSYLCELLYRMMLHNHCEFQPVMDESGRIISCTEHYVCVSLFGALCIVCACVFVHIH